MRVDNLTFKTANEAEGKSPRFVVVIVFDVGSLYITSHSDITSVPGIVLQKALKRPSAISQKLVPDEGRSEIGTFSFDVVDVDHDFTDEVRAKLAAGKGLRGKTVQLWYGFKGFDFTAFQLFQTQIITGVEYDAGLYSVTCEDIARQQRTNIFEPKETTLAATCSATDTTINVASTTAFLSVAHGSAWSDSPSATPYYFKLEQEIVKATGKTSTTFTGCARGQFNTVAAAHTVDPASAQERRPKVTEFIYLDMPAPKLALALQLGVIPAVTASPWPGSFLAAQGGFETDTNADGLADGWSIFIGGLGDGARVQTASRPAGSSPFVSVCQRLAITSVTNTNDSAIQNANSCRAGLRLTASGYIRTNVSGKVKIVLRYLDAASAILLDASSSFVTGDSIAHFAQVTQTAPALTEFVSVIIRGINAAGEFFEVDQFVLELGDTPSAYTGTGIAGVLPQHWHMGIPVEFVQVSDFTGIGVDLWNPADDSAGFITRFEGMTRNDGKRFVEKELYLLLGAYSPIYSNGKLGLRRLPAMISDAGAVAVLTEREIVSITPLQHDYKSLHNQIRVTWGYDIGVGRFTRDTLFIDGQSMSIHGLAPPIEFSFRGLHSGMHTENMIRVRLNAFRDAYTYPPQRTSVTTLGSLNRYETGDVMRLKVHNVRDFAGSTDDIDRAFLAIQRSIDFVTGAIEFEMFGSTLRPDATGPSNEVTAPLPDAFYTAAGVALSTVVGMTGNSVNAGTHTITGNASLIAAGAIVYHNADLVIPSGATINITANVQLRVRGFITMNGAINGVGGGLAGVADPGGVLTDPIAGNPGFIGNSRGWDGVKNLTTIKGGNLVTWPAAFTRAKYEAWPEPNLTVVGNNLNGLPTDLRGTGGGPGGRAFAASTSTTVNGGPGVAGGAGLAIICRGISFGVSASITLDGNSSAVTTVLPGLFNPVFPGAGGAGAPGACLIALDGNTLLFPNALGRFRARCGTVPLQGVPLPTRVYSVFDGGLFFGPFAADDRASGYQDEQLVTALDMSIAALRVAYVPYPQVVASDQNQLPPPITALAAVTGLSEQITIRATLPAAGTFDQVEYYAAIANNRAGAVLIAKGRMSEFQHDGLAVLQTKYFWARTTRVTAAGVELFSDWFPTSPTGGVTATTSNQGPVGVYFDGFESPWENAFANIANAGGVVITYPANGQFGGKVIKAQNQLWIQSNFNIPFDPNSLYRITTRIRRTASGGGSNENVYCGVSGVAADGVTMIDEAGGTSAGSQHFNCARGFDMSAIAVNTWKDHVGYFKGLGTSGFGVAPNNEFPTPLRTGVVFFRPVLILNYNSGSGTMECDGIVVERLPTPDDADNSDKARIIPDTEFIRATDQSFWWFWQSGGGTLPSIVLTGGNYGGYCNIPGNGLATSNWIVSRRKTFYQAARGQIYTVTIRIRDVAGTFNGLATAGLIRHARAYSNSTFDPTPASGLAAYCHGGITIQGVPADWTEYSGIVFVPGVSGFTDGDLPAISAIVGPAVATTGSFDVDMVKVEPGATVPPQSEAFTASNNFSGDYSRLLKNCQFNHATVAGTFTLPTATAEIVGARMYFEQTNAALLTIAVQGGDTLQASPNLTGSRNSAGRYARMYAEAVAVNTWRLYGQYV